MVRFRPFLGMVPGRFPINGEAKAQSGGTPLYKGPHMSHPGPEASPHGARDIWTKPAPWTDVSHIQVTGEAGDHTRTTTNTAAVGKLAGRLKPDGSWVLYDYDGEGRKTLEIHPWKDLAWTTAMGLTLAEAKAAGRAIEYSYASVSGSQTTYPDIPIDADARPRTITESIEGTVVSRTYHVYAIKSGEAVHITESAATGTAAFGATGNLRTIETYNASGLSYLRAGRIKTIEYPDDRLDTYSYQAYDVYMAAPPHPLFDGADCERFSTTLTRGTVESPGGVPYRTTVEGTTQDGGGRQLRVASSVYKSAGDSEAIDWTDYTYDDQWHVTGEYRSDGTHTTTEWDCCGKSSETLPDGRQYSYVYDALGRLVIRTQENGTRPAIITTYTYDGAGNILSTTTAAEGTALSLETSGEVDLSGRSTRTIDPGGLLALTSYDDTTRSSTATSPGGGTTVTARYIDGQAKSMTGTAVTDTYYDYGVDTTTGWRWTTVYTGELPGYGDFTAIPMWRRIWVDVLGRTVKVQVPTFPAVHVTNPAITTTEYSYDTKGRLERVTAPDSKQTVYEYDTTLGELLRTGQDVNLDGNLDLATDARISESSTVYEKDGSDVWWWVTTRKVYSVEDDDPTTAGTDERTVPVTVSVSRVRLTGLGGAAPASYSGVLAAESRHVDAHNNETVNYTCIDAANRIAWQVTDSPFSSVNQVAKTVNGLLDYTTSTSNLTTHYLYDALGRRTGVTDPRISTETAGVWSNYSETHYNSFGQIDWTKDTAGNQTTYTYDNPSTGETDTQRIAHHGLLTAVTDALSRVTSAHYDPATGRKLAIWGTTYPIRYEYDEHGRMARMHTLRDTTVTISSYQDFLDNASNFDTTAWSYDPATGLLSSKDYAGTATGPSYEYNQFGQLYRRDWERGVYTTYTYSGSSNELTAVDYSDSTPDVSFTHGRMGLTKTVSDAAGTRTYAHNDDGPLNSETFGSTAYLPGASIGRNYDTQGRYTGFHAASTGPGNVAYSVPAAAYAFDGYGRFQSVTSDSETFTYGYTTGSDLVGTVSHPNSLVTTWTYETTRSLVDHVENKVGATTVSKYDYTNDDIGRRGNVQKSGTAFSATDTVTWSYDAFSQVTGAEATNDATYDYDFTYDPIGNRKTSVTEETGTPMTSTYASNQLNQYTAVTGLSPAPAYDNDGNMATNGGWSYAWDGENRLESAESSTARYEYGYDFMSRRIERRSYTGTTGNWTLSETRRFLYDGWHLIAEYTIKTVDGDTRPALVATHLWGLDLSQTVGGAGGVGGLLRTRGYSIAADGTLVPGTRYYPTYDANGNVSEYLDGSGTVASHYEYSPFGRYASGTYGSSSTPFTFSTKYADPSSVGLYYYGYRFYSPKLGRWISRDPIGEEGGMNLYAALGNSAIDEVDILGLQTPCCEGSVSASSGLVTPEVMAAKIFSYQRAGSSYSRELWMCILAKENWRGGGFHRGKNKGSGAAGYSQVMKGTAKYIEESVERYSEWVSKYGALNEDGGYKYPPFRNWLAGYLREHRGRIPYGFVSYGSFVTETEFMLNPGESLYEGIVRSEASDLLAGGWLLEDSWRKSGSKKGAVKGYGDGTEGYVNSVLNCEKCLQMRTEDWAWYGKVFDSIQLPFMTGEEHDKCPCDKIE